MSTTTPKQAATVGMDMVPPYAVYIDGKEVARHATECEARALCNELAGRNPGKTLLGEDAYSNACCKGTKEAGNG